MVGEIFGVKGSSEEIFEYSSANATQNAIDGLIDPTSNLKDKSVFIMSCELDKIINPQQHYAQKLFFENFDSNVHFEQHPFEHILPVIDGDDMGIDSRGNYDGVGAILNHLLPNIPGTGVKTVQPRYTGVWQKFGEIREFAQMEFVDRDTK